MSDMVLFQLVGDKGVCHSHYMHPSLCLCVFMYAGDKLVSLCYTTIEIHLMLPRSVHLHIAPDIGIHNAK